MLLAAALAPGMVARADTCPVSIGDNCYEHINDAFNAVPNDGTKTIVTVNQNLTDEDGIGLFRTGASRPTNNTYENADQKVIELDLGGYTVTFGNSKMVGSGDKYAYQNIHLEKGNTVTIKNGKFVSNPSTLLMFQNYSNLTLQDVIVDGTKQDPYYTLSNCNGIIKLLGSTSILAPEGSYAFDVDYQGAYPDGVSVTLDTTGTIKGNIEVDSDSKAQLTIKNATIEGEIQGGNGSNITVEQGSYEGNVEVVVPDGSATYTNTTTGMTVVVPEDKLVVMAFDAAMEPTEEENTKINEALEEGYVVGKVLDITTWLVNPNDGNAKVEEVTDNTETLNVTISVADLPAPQEGYTRVYKVIRVHNGETTVIDAADNGNGTVTFQSNLFSTYALTYVDQAPATGNNENTNTNNPQTADKIILYISALVISSVAVTGTALYLNKRY
jgi:hypothetical protein